MTFALSSIPDQNAADAAVDKLVFLFNPVTNTSNTYYLDNIQIKSTAPKENLVLADVWEDYDANDKLTLNTTTGAYSPKVANPKPGGSNTSANVAKYVRNANEPYDLLIFNKGTATINAGALKARQQKLALDVYTDAPAGTPLLMGLDASSLLGTSETSGKHSNYLAVTTVQGAWHTVYFTYGSSPDPNVPDNLVDHVAILPELGQKTGTTYYFDNLRTVNVVQQPTLTTLALTPALSQNVAVGQKIQFAAQGKDQSGANIAAPGVTWQASGGGTIDANGLFTATTNGAFKVTATSGGLTSTADVLIGQGLKLTKLTVDPLATFINQSSTLRLTARGYDQTGQPVSFAPTWMVSGATGVSVSGDGVLTASATASGTAAVVASSGGVTATSTITVRTPPAADSLVVTPAARKVEQGDALQFAAGTFDQYGNPIASPASWSVNGGGSISGGGLFTSTTIGTFVVKAQAGAAAAATYVSVVPKPLNLALRKSVRASSVQNSGLLPLYAVDGVTGRTNPDTRWASQGPTIVDGQVIRDDPQWLRVDLGRKYDLTRVALYWENAYGKAYTIQVADDTLQARRTAYTEANGDGNTDDFALPAGTSGRYVWLNATGRATPYGYSLYELEVYGLPHQDPALTGIIVTPNFGKTAPGKAVAFKALGFDQFGNNSAIAPTWTTSGGTISGVGSFSAPAAGDYTVTAMAGGRSGAATITVKAGTTPPPTPGGPNLALNKPIRASSVENGGTPARFANDGSGVNGTRWSSSNVGPAADAQWLRVDLGATYNVNRVNILWEGAYGKDYVIEIAPDTVNWQPLKTVTGNTGLTNDWTGLAGTGRYVRMKGVQRGTGYGYSIWELEVYGTAAGSTAPVLTSISVSPATASIAAGASQQLTAQGKDQNGSNFAVTPTWTTTGGTVSSAGVFSAATAGTYTLTATSGSVKGSATVTVTAAPPTPGGPNLALNKPIRASSVENGGTLARFANDGDGSTRWGSQWSDDQWLRVDLGATYSVNRVKISWEGVNAYGRDYVVEIASDTVNWQPLKTVTGNSALTNDWTGLAGTGRYVRMKGVQRGTGYGYSIWELEVYGTTAARPAAVLGTAPAGLAPALSVYPNPVTQTVTLTGLPADATSLAVYDVRGALVRHVRLAQAHATETIDVAELRSGVYVIQVTSLAGVRTQRFVKQ